MAKVTLLDVLGTQKQQKIK